MLKPKLAAGAEPALLTAQTPNPIELTPHAAAGDADAQQQLEQGPGSGQMLDQEIALAQIDGSIKLSALKRIGDTISAAPPEAASVIRQWMNA